MTMNIKQRKIKIEPQHIQHMMKLYNRKIPLDRYSTWNSYTLGSSILLRNCRISSTYSYAQNGRTNLFLDKRYGKNLKKLPFDATQCFYFENV